MKSNAAKASADHFVRSLSESRVWAAIEARVSDLAQRTRVLDLFDDALEQFQIMARR